MAQLIVGHGVSGYFDIRLTSSWQCSPIRPYIPDLNLGSFPVVSCANWRKGCFSIGRERCLCRLFTSTILRFSIEYQETGTTLRWCSPLHCWGGDSFSELLAELEKNFHLVVLDIHGHGASGYRNGMTLEVMTEDFYLLLRKLSFQKVVWFGCSIGGMIGMRLALAHPDVLDSLVLMATTARLDPPEIEEATLHLWAMFRDGHREDIADSAMSFFFAARTY